MIVVVSRIRVTSGDIEALAGRYRQRGRIAETMPGCLGVEVLRHIERPEEFAVYTRWESREAYERYRHSPAFREAHATIRTIPGGLKIDAAERAVEWYEVLS